MEEPAYIRHQGISAACTKQRVYRLREAKTQTSSSGVHDSWGPYSPFSGLQDYPIGVCLIQGSFSPLAYVIGCFSPHGSFLYLLMEAEYMFTTLCSVISKKTGICRLTHFNTAGLLVVILCASSVCDVISQKQILDSLRTLFTVGVLLS